MVSGCLCGWVYLGSLEMDGCVNASADVGQPETLIRVSYGLLASRALAWGWGGGWGGDTPLLQHRGELCFQAAFGCNRMRQPETMQRYANLFSGCL